MSAARGIRAGRAFVELATNDTKLAAGLKAAQAKLNAFGKGVAAVGASMLAVGGAATGALVGAAKLFSDQGDAIAKLAKRTGLSTEAVSELGYAAELSGTDIGTLEIGIRKMQSAVTDAVNGNKAAIQTFDRLGVSVDQLRGLTPDQQLEILADRLAAISDPATRAALAQDLFGKSGTQLIPMLEEGSAGLRNMRKEAVLLGLSVSGKTAASAEVLNDSIGRLKATLGAVVFNTGAAVAPLLADLADKAAIVVAGIVEWIKANPEVVQTALQIAAAVAAVGVVLGVVGGAIVALGAVISGIVSIIGAVTTAIGFIAGVIGAITAPVWIVIGAIVAAGAALLYFTDIASTAIDWVSGVFGELASIVKDTLGGVVDALMAGNIELAVQILWQGIKTLWEAGLATILNIWTNWIHDLAGAIVVIETTIKNIFDAITSWIGKKLGDLARLLGLDKLVLGVSLDQSEFDKSQKLIDEQTAARERANEKQQDSAIGAIEAARRAEVDANEKNLRDAQKELKESIDRAKELRDKKDRLRKTPSKGRDPVSPDEVSPVDKAIAAAKQVRSSTFTTFSSTNLEGLGVSSQIVQKLERNTAETTKLVREIKGFLETRTSPIVFE